MRSALLCGPFLLALVDCGSSAAGGVGGTSGAAGMSGAAGTSGAAPLAPGTYAGMATSPDCVGFQGTGCPLQITITGSGPTYEVSGFTLPGGISGTGNTVTQTGGELQVDLQTAGTADFCPAAEYTGTGSVGAGGTSMSVTLTGPPCGSSDAAFISLTLSKQ